MYITMKVIPWHLSNIGVWCHKMHDWVSGMYASEAQGMGVWPKLPESRGQASYSLCIS